MDIKKACSQAAGCQKAGLRGDFLDEHGPQFHRTNTVDFTVDVVIAVHQSNVF